MDNDRCPIVLCSKKLHEGGTELHTGKVNNNLKAKGGGHSFQTISFSYSLRNLCNAQKYVTSSDWNVKNNMYDY